MKGRFIAAILVVFMIVTAMPVIASVSKLEGTDKTGDVSDGNVDIVAFGIEPSGSEVIAWIQVSGSIYKDFPSKYSGGGVTYTFKLTDDDSGDNYFFNYVIDENGVGGTYTTPSSIGSSNYTINGNKLIFHIPSSFFDSLSSRYSIQASTSASGNSAFAYDGTGIWYSYKEPEPEEGSSASIDSEKVLTAFGMAIGLCVGVVVIIIVIIALVIYFIVRKPKNKSPQQPPAGQQYQYQQYNQYNQQQYQRPPGY